MRVQQVHGHVRQTSHDSVKDIEDRRHEDKGKFDRLGDPPSGSRSMPQRTGSRKQFFFITGMRFVVHRRASRRQCKQHQRKLALHKFTGILVGVAAKGFGAFFQHFEPDSLVAMDNWPALGGCNRQTNTRMTDTRYGADQAGSARVRPDQK